MNRTLGFAAAIMFAVAGLAMLGGEKSAEAGWGCCGCHGGARVARCGGGNNGCGGCHGGLFSRHCGGRCSGVADCGGCSGASSCCGCHGGLLARWRARRCCGANTCCGAQVSCCGCDGGVPVDGGDIAPPPAHDAGPPAPPAPAEASIRPVITRVSFVR